MTSIFEYTDYKAYLKAVIKGSELRGISSRLAEAAGCQRSYFSSVLNSKIHLLPDHLFGISEVLKLSLEENEYFFLILDYQRGTLPNYRKFLLKKIQEKQSHWKDLKNRVAQKPLVDSKNELILQHYFSNYLYAALHIAVSIPQLQELKHLAPYFGLSETVLLSYLETLKAMGVVEQKGQRWLWKHGDHHLPTDSAWIQTHHTNWRMQALNELILKKSDSLHYSVVQSLSKSDMEKLRFRMVEWVKEFKEKAGPSAPEELICFNLDFFSLNKS